MLYDDLKLIGQLTEKIEQDWHRAKRLCPIPTDILEYTAEIRRVCSQIANDPGNKPQGGTVAPGHRGGAPAG
jgi:hypothetical protein